MVTICTNKNDIMNSVSDEEDLDIAHMSDFSDDEDGSQEESRPVHRPDVFWIVHLMRPCLDAIDRSLIR